ncbi:protein phosphatase 2C domain-containing protein [uncultured Thiocystis sp.]|jgi:hypothetical protein|uniref:protein phosphatase 2C domain-containing protein n=1 Tax=uncultured Thiocystis sp. TaxID=1202134 RepID=UPI0025D85735|nr:protein phosphatase 2C domain-containing protein [uncultured Thiocystis sp.]
MTFESFRGVTLFGASVTGPRHQSQGQPNQDAWLKVQGRFGSLAVVCDGLGSRSASSLGANGACQAVRQAVTRWPGAATGAAPADLIRLVEVLWRFILSSHHADDCATTCQFALRETNGTLVIAGLGDGALLIRENSDGVKCYGGRSGADFANETLALGIPHKLRDWWVEVLPPHPHRSVVIASDGVADDLRPDRLDGFIGWLTEEMAPLPAHQRWRRLQTELRHWPVPHHTDDKTLAVMIEMEMDEQ